MGPFEIKIETLKFLYKMSIVGLDDQGLMSEVGTYLSMYKYIFYYLHSISCEKNFFAKLPKYTFKK